MKRHCVPNARAECQAPDKEQQRHEANQAKTKIQRVRGKAGRQPQDEYNIGGFRIKLRHDKQENTKNQYKPL